MLNATIKEQNGHTRKLTINEIVTHTITFVMAGYDTTTSALSCTSYLLALNPTVQEKLHKEIEEYFKINPVSCLDQSTFHPPTSKLSGTSKIIKMTTACVQ